MSDSPARTNRLAAESSPYLLLHAKNPVDWYPWGPEALAKAKAEDKPIFLSVGYSTCFWCHVMERESFSDPAVAALMNDEFVNIKVDREERLDLDEIYMLATQVLAGQGGWPNSVFLTPDLKPFFAGTYFPPLDARGRPGFPTVLRSMIHAWKERRSDVLEQGEELAEAIRRHLAEIEPVAGALPGGEPAERALAALREKFDPTWGGFGGAPKFPSPANLLLLLAFADDAVPHPKASEAAMMLAAQLDAMARGGIYDQLAGGFHRYATDREWKVPHFEKMLYDNGLLLEIYAREHARSGSAEAARIGRETAEFLGREMTSPEGALWSAIDAETGGREGAFYVWTRDELELALGQEGAIFLAPLFGFHGEPFFEENRYVLHLPRALEVQAKERRLTRAALLEEIAPLRLKLCEVRARRRRPATDNKILADWNGIAIAGLAVAGQTLAEPALVAQAQRAADFVLTRMRSDDGVGGAGGTLLHSWRGGAGRILAGLTDYVFLVRGLLRLHEATGERRWLDAAVRLTDQQESRLASPRGGFFNIADAPDLLVRGKEIFDGALPAANGVAAHNLLDLAEATGEPRFLDLAERTLRAFAPLVDRHPEGAKTMALALARFARAEPPGSVESNGSLRSGESIVSATLSSAKGGSGSLDDLGSRAQGVVEAALRVDAPDAAGRRPFVLTLAVERGWHLDANLRLEGVNLELDPASLIFPQPEATGEPGSHLYQQAFRGRVVIAGRARSAPGAAAEPRLKLKYQACDDHRCLPPTEKSIPFPSVET